MATHQFSFSDGAPCSLARKLIAEGKADRSDRLMMLRDGKPALSGGIGWFADRRLQETAKVGPRYVKWTPFPGDASLARTAFDAPEVE
jgi:hypothetical protein